ncbi:helix-turn-helix transcriptional regulator [Luedemannella helvata]|uniref:Helix-turn-helix transcriptional regulator n=1 Tax=Luedemannella helvata TaxID=349315 RepID=A0ABP4WT44_9ACTN
MTSLIGQDPAVVRQRLCRHLVRLRGDRSQQGVADALAWSRSKVIRIESGSIGISTADLRALLELYQVRNPATVELLVHMARESRRQVGSPYADVLSPELAFYLRYEASALRLRQYHPNLVPGLLQTEEYAEAVITAFAGADASRDIIKRQVAARMARQAVLRGRVRAHFVLDEAALRRDLGDHLMRRQLAHLAEVARRPNVTVQLLPFAAGLLGGAQWPFVLLDFPGAEGDTETLLYLEGRSTSVIRDDPAELARHQLAFDELSAAASPIGAAGVL